MASVSHHPDISCDVVLMGDAFVGKTCIIHRHCQGMFSDKSVSTVGISCEITNVTTVDGKLMQISFLDTAGQERFDSVLPMFYRKADAFVLVYDITNRSSFERLTKWMDDIEKQRSPKFFNTNLMLIGNKVDLLSSRKVTYEEGLKFAKDNQMLYFETSAKTGENIDEAFNFLVGKLSELAKIVDAFENFQESVQLSAMTNTRRRQKCCSKNAPTPERSNTSLREMSTPVTSPQRRHASFSGSESSSGLSPGDHICKSMSILSIDDLCWVRRGVGSLTNWFDVGVELGLSYSTLKEIKKDEKNIGDCTREMIVAWLDQRDQVESHGGPTWKQLASALRRYKHKQLAKNLEQSYLSDSIDK